MRRLCCAAALVYAFAIPLESRAHAQAACNGKPFTGTVQDSTAAVIPGATIHLDGGGTGQIQTSGSDGRFLFPCVSPGSRHLTTSALRFALLQQDLSMPVPAEFHITLVPADSVTVNVDAEAPATEPILGGLNGTTLSGAPHHVQPLTQLK